MAKRKGMSPLKASALALEIATRQGVELEHFDEIRPAVSFLTDTLRLRARTMRSDLKTLEALFEPVSEHNDIGEPDEATASNGFDQA